MRVIYELQSILEPLELERVFPENRPLEIELGSGDGTFLVQLAARKPQHNFLGVERLLGRIRKTGRKAERAGLGNVRVVRIESSYFLQYLLPGQSARALHIYFPDPWPKRKHRRFRLINQEFPPIARRVLVPGGRVYLRTDDADYFQQMTSVFGAAQEFMPVETPAELAGLVTDFEAEFQARGVQTRRAAYELKARNCAPA